MSLVLEDVARLAVKYVADSVKGGEAYGAYLAGLHLGEIDVGYAHLLRELIQRHLSVCHYAVESHDNSHSAPALERFICLLLQLGAVLKNEGKGEQAEGKDEGLPTQEQGGNNKDDADDLEALDVLRQKGRAVGHR